LFEGHRFADDFRRAHGANSVDQVFFLAPPHFFIVSLLHFGVVEDFLQGLVFIGERIIKTSCLDDILRSTLEEGSAHLGLVLREATLVVGDDGGMPYSVLNNALDQNARVVLSATRASSPAGAANALCRCTHDAAKVIRRGCVPWVQS